MDKLHVDYIITGGLLSMTMIAGVATASMNASADDVVDEINITIPTACTMGGTIIEGDEHTTSLQPGTYESGIGKTTLTTYCNDPGGFSIYAIGFTGDAYTGDNHTKLVGNTATNTISTGLTTGTSTTDVSSWAMKLSAVAGTYAPTIMDGTNDTEDFTNYHIVPDTYTKVATYGNTTDAEGGTGSSLETTYAVYASLTQPADTYTGKVKYTLVHPASEPAPITPQTTQTGKIRYYANVSDYEGTMRDQNIAASVTLLPSNFSRTGYGFAGWSDKFDYATNPEAKFYGPNETITLNTADYTGTNPGLSLYAVWVKSQGNLQDSDKVASVCNSLTAAPIDGTANLSSVSALTDSRDNNTYAIAKLADNKCWMIENMRLDNTNSDNTTGALAQGYATNATYGNFVGLANPEDPWKINSTTANSLYSTDGADNTTNIGSSYATYRFPRYNNQNTSDRAPAPAIGANTYGYGNYYTWAAAIADLNNYTSNNASVTNTSICPTGWHLPIGGDKKNATNSEFWTLGVATMGAEPANTSSELYSYYQSSETNSAGKTATLAFRSYPNNFLYSGYVYSESVYGRGSYGYYWLSTVGSTINAYILNLDSTNVYPGTYNGIKYYGRTVRCLASS